MVSLSNSINPNPCGSCLEWTLEGLRGGGVEGRKEGGKNEETGN